VPEFVVRGGIATALRLQQGYKEHLRVQGLYGCSVQYRPGRSILQLANAGQFPHPVISYATDECIIQAAQRLGYTMAFVSSPGGGFHNTLTAAFSANGATVMALPDDLAAALSDCFQQDHNPFPRL